MLLTLVNLRYQLLLAAMVANTAYAGISPAISKVIGHLPVASDLTITPVAPKAGEAVTVTWTYHDSDNDAQSGTLIEWLLEGSVFGATGNRFTLPGDAAGKALQVRITPRSAAPADPAQGRPVTTAGSLLQLTRLGLATLPSLRRP